MEKVFYLKVFTDKFFTFNCVQYWLNVAYNSQAHIYIICEKKNLIQYMLNNLYFGTELLNDYCKKRENDPVIFSAYFEELKEFSSAIVDSYWVNACVSHLSTFYHAKLNNFDSFWNIDADDCIFYTPYKKTSEALSVAEKIANEQDIKLFSFDFWNSDSNGAHWSFGITHTKMNYDYTYLIQQSITNIHSEWNKCNLPNNLRNLDWFYTFIKRKNLLNIKTFYINNSIFCHYGFCNNEFLPGTVLQCFNNQEMKYLTNCYCERLYIRKIQPDNICIDIELPNINFSEQKKYYSIENLSPLFESLKTTIILELNKNVLKIKEYTFFGFISKNMHKLMHKLIRKHL